MKIFSFLIFSTGANRVPRSGNFFSTAENLNLFYDPMFSRLDGAYGCFCNYFEGDRQFSQPGFGPRPVDASDAVCKAHKECLACVRDEFGDECIPEGVDMVYNHENGQCTDDKNTCKRALCECQKQAAIDQAKVKHTRTSSQFHWLFSGIASSLFKTQISNFCAAKDLVLTSSIPQAAEDTRFSAHNEFYEANVCFKSSQGLTLRTNGAKWELLSEDTVLYTAKTEGCPDKVSTWINAEDGTEVNLELEHLSSNNPVGEKRCCKNNDGGYKVFNNGNHQCCEDGSVKPNGLC
ncbi:unnamed protein product [Oikopleura dioica]|uniref:Phospholipase A2 domain-containing protein n=1 Tax=Oikopleura dioica TaxID=34765 RepID=E4X4A3_OIKDI|nr:unnamed protein product [Oikopleura dioica]